MELQHKQPQSIIAYIVNSQNVFMQFSFLQFLSADIILNFAIKAQQFKYPHYFFKLALTIAFFKKYLNRVDRSMYYVFYDDQEYKALQKKFISHFAQIHTQKLIQSQQKYQNILNKFSQEIQILSEPQEFNQIIQNTFFETDFPLPPCKRQTIGVYCQTPFQQFLALQRFPAIGGDQFTQPPLDELKEKIMDEMENTVNNIKENNQQFVSKMCLIRFCGYQIKNTNWENLLIENFVAHNVIVFLFSLISMNAKMSATLIEQQQDPIMKLSEFITRANIYTNIVLAVEEKFGFLFQFYGDIFQLSYKNAIKLPKFSFWNSAMTIWAQETQPYQGKIQQSFCYVSLKLREQHILEVLQSQSQRFPSIYNGVKLQYEQKSLCQPKRNQVYKNVQGAVSYQTFFQKNMDSYQVLAKDYLEHTQDISINQITVHRCDHSQHQIIKSPYFQAFSKSIIQSSVEFYNNMQRVVFKKLSDKQLRLSILKDLIKQDLHFINGKFVKPVILKQIFNSAQELINSSINKMKQFHVFQEEGIEKFALKFDFSHKDNLLDYFSSKAQIPVNVSASMASFYNTFKQKSPQVLIDEAMNDKDNQSIQSQIDDQAYDSSLSNSSFMSNQQ